MPAAATGGDIRIPEQRFERPSVESDEGGLWALMDREETRLRRSPMAVRDAGLTEYLNRMVCRLTPVHCVDIRIHVVRTPLYNATMAPNGMMQVWSGLLLRVENEAQLAAVIGHEVAHYLERHSIERLRDARSRAAFAQFLALFGVVGALGQLGVLAGSFAYSREHESRADRLGMHMLQASGWRGEEAPKVWANLLDEAKVLGGDSVGSRSPLFATHPAIDTRREDLQRLVVSGGEANLAALAAAVAPHRLAWIQDELRRGQYEESLALFGRMVRNQPDDVQALFARGEAYRLRNGAGDAERALADLTAATAQQAAVRQVPAEAWRSVGLVHKGRRDAPAALNAFERYLAAAPEASDAALIKHFVSELKP